MTRYQDTEIPGCVWLLDR